MKERRQSTLPVCGVQEEQMGYVTLLSEGWHKGVCGKLNYTPTERTRAEEQRATQSHPRAV